jgi:hypothetical protein
MAESGYSSTPLAKKLGLKPGAIVLIQNSPKDYFQFFEDAPEELIFSRESGSDAIDFIHAFCVSNDQIEEVNKLLKPRLKTDGMLWISWPKGSSKKKAALNRDIIRAYFLAKGLVDVKVASIDEDWSGLKFVYRLKDR